MDHPVCNYPTSDLLFKTRNNVRSLLQDRQLGLWLLAAEMQGAHASELDKRIVNISYPDPADQPTKSASDLADCRKNKDSPRCPPFPNRRKDSRPLRRGARTSNLLLKSGNKSDGLL